MLRVGLTGGIGAGKSTVAARLARHGAIVVDADRLAREVVAPGTTGLAEIVAHFGAEVLTADGELDRPALGRIVFADPDARARLNAITHPRIGALTLEAFAAAPAEAIVVHDVPLLVENAMGARYQLVLVVHADADERVRRLVEERGMSAEDARARVSAQADDDARRAAADVWLDNSGPRSAVIDAVDRLWDARLVPFEANLRARRPAPLPDRAVVVDADPDWPQQAARIIDRVRAAAGGRALRVEHVGPTAAAAGTPAPDVLDLRLVVADLATADGLREDLERIGLARCDSDDERDGNHELDGEGTTRWHASCDPGRPALLRVCTQGNA